MDNRLVIAKKELRSLLDEKTIVLAIAIQLFIAGFSSFLVVGLVALYDPGTAGAGATAVGVTGDATDQVSDAVEAADLTPRTYDTYPDAVRAFESGEVDAILSTDASGDTLNVTAAAPQSSLRTTQVVVQVRDALKELERTTRLERADRLRNDPLPLPEDPRSSPYFDFTYTVLVPLLMFLPVFISGSITSDAVTEEQERGTLELLRVAPINGWGIVEGKMLAYAAIAPIQAAAWIALLALNDTPIHNSGAILLLVAALSLVAVALGATVALAFGDRRRAQLVYSLSVILLFGGSALLLNPFNAVALLAIGSPSAGTTVAVAAYLALAALLAIGLRAAFASRIGEAWRRA